MFYPDKILSSIWHLMCDITKSFHSPCNFLEKFQNLNMSEPNRSESSRQQLNQDVPSCSGQNKSTRSSGLSELQDFSRNFQLWPDTKQHLTEEMTSSSQQKGFDYMSQFQISFNADLSESQDSLSNSNTLDVLDDYKPSK